MQSVVLSLERRLNQDSWQLNVGTTSSYLHSSFNCLARNAPGLSGTDGYSMSARPGALRALRLSLEQGDGNVKELLWQQVESTTNLKNEERDNAKQQQQ